MASSWPRGSWPPGSRTWVTGSGDGGHGPVELVGRAERVGGARHEQAGHVQGGEVLGAQPVGPARRVQRVAEQDQPGRRQSLGHRHRRHPPAERPAPQHQAIGPHAHLGHQGGGLLAHGGHGHRRLVGGAAAGSAVGEVHAGRRAAGRWPRPPPPGCGGSRSAPAPGASSTRAGGGSARSIRSLRPGAPISRAGSAAPRSARRSAGPRPPRRHRGRDGPRAAARGTGSAPRPAPSAPTRRGAAAPDRNPSTSRAHDRGFSSAEADRGRPRPTPASTEIRSSPTRALPAHRPAHRPHHRVAHRRVDATGGVDRPEHLLGGQPVVVVELEVEGLAVADQAMAAALQADLVLLEPVAQPGLGDATVLLQLGGEAHQVGHQVGVDAPDVLGHDAARAGSRRSRAAGRWAACVLPSDTRRVGAMGREW